VIKEKGTTLVYVRTSARIKAVGEVHKNREQTEGSGEAKEGTGWSPSEYKNRTGNAREKVKEEIESRHWNVGVKCRSEQSKSGSRYW